MRFREFITEATSLTVGKITKYPTRIAKFLELVKNKHTFQSKHGPVQIDPKELTRIKGVLTGQTRMMTKSLMVKTLQGTTISTGDLFYNQVEFGEKGKGGDSEIELKPTPVFGHGKAEPGQDLTPELAVDMGAFPAKNLGAKIQSNEYLSTQGVAGQAVKEISKQISKKQVPLIPQDLSKSQLSSIVNDAYEYLGVQALVDGVINFPNIEDFYTHIGTNMSEMFLFFPGSTNNPLADSYAIQNRQTGNQIFLSSKGGRSGGGAPSSINKVKIPDNMLKQYKNDESLEFLKFIQGVKPWQQPFESAKFIKEKSKDPNSLGELLPFVDQFDSKFYNWAADTLRQKDVPKTLSKIPKEYQDLFNLVQRTTSGSNYPLFFNLRNAVKDKFVGPAVNSGKPFPQFNARMLEILGHNFVLISSKAEGGKINTKATWPYKMGGTITLEPKDPANKWNAAMSWKLTGA